MDVLEFIHITCYKGLLGFGNPRKESLEFTGKKFKPPILKVKKSRFAYQIVCDF